MPANAEQYTRVCDTRGAKTQTSIPSRFAAHRPQAQSVDERHDRLEWGSLLTTQPAADGASPVDKAISTDLDECIDNTSPSSIRQPPPSTGLPTRFRRLSLSQNSTVLRHDSFTSTRSLKRKAAAEWEQDIAPRPQSRRRTVLNQPSNAHNDNIGRGRGGVSTRTPTINNEAINPFFGFRCLATTIPSDADIGVVELSDESEDDDSDDDLHITSVQRATKNHKPVVVPRVLIPSKESIRVNRVVGPQLQQGTVVEFADSTFMQIHKIYEDQKQGHLLIGYMFVRANTVGPEMPRKRDSLQWTQTRISNEPDTRFPLYYRGGELINEVIQKIRTVVGEDKADYGLWRRPIRDVVRTRSLRITNQSYDDINCTTNSHISAARATITTVRRAGMLHCRWKDITVHNRQGKWQEQYLERPSDEKCDAAWCSDSDELRRAWRGVMPPITDADSVHLCDGFCGAGGMSQGAKQAGLKVILAFDKDEKKIVTYRKNHPDCRSLIIDATKFIALAGRKGLKVDVLHLSFPCQPYSPANVTHNIEKDEQNQAPLLGCAEIIEALRPRVVTVEETNGIRDSRYTPWFNALLQQFTSLGFCVRWSNLTCADYGVPQLRQRPILIAAASGEDLPPFPRPTHTRGTVSIATTLREVAKAHRASPLSHHDTSKNLVPQRPPYDPHRLAKTITCGGGIGNYHPTGSRNLTGNEAAALQTFPVRYDWGTMTLTELRIQAGNAVPPLFAEAILRSVDKSLRATDKRRLAKMRDEARKNIIDLTTDLDDEAGTTLVDQNLPGIRRDYET